MENSADFSIQCPLPIADYPTILMAHGGGGRLTQQLIEHVFLKAFANPALDQRHDAAVLDIGGLRLAFTTDSYVVHPLFFPGGDIGKLAVCGTINDLAMCGAKPKWLSAGFIIEEGLPMGTLQRVVDSMRLVCEATGVQLVTGDTKVVDRGKGDGLFINTAGLGVLEYPSRIGPAEVQEGDAIILSGDLGRHGMAIMSVREGLEFESPILSDCAPLWAPVAALLQAGIPIRCLRDLTRGGLAAVLNEIAEVSGRRLDVIEDAVAVTDEVRGACEILGLDPMYVANEGRFVAIVSESRAAEAIQILESFPGCDQADRIGRVGPEERAIVTLRNQIGAVRILDLLTGEQLPRIC